MASIVAERHGMMHDDCMVSCQAKGGSCRLQFCTRSAGLLQPADSRCCVCVQALTGPQLGGLIGGMVAADSVARPHITAAYAPSEAVLNAVEAMEPARSHLFELQSAGNVMFPLEVDLRLAGVHACRFPLCLDQAGLSHCSCSAPQ